MKLEFGILGFFSLENQQWNITFSEEKLKQQ